MSDTDTDAAADKAENGVEKKPSLFSKPMFWIVTVGVVAVIAIAAAESAANPGRAARSTAPGATAPGADPTEPGAPAGQ